MVKNGLSARKLLGNPKTPLNGSLPCNLLGLSKAECNRIRIRTRKDLKRLKDTL